MAGAGASWAADSSTVAGDGVTGTSSLGSSLAKGSILTTIDSGSVLIV
ncbi:MAG: hypothetical protein UX99_C0036G0001, partial [Candidatus Amesbacteria bacterium GW2011_GWB1_47_26]